jgi:hypothetical protein
MALREINPNEPQKRKVIFDATINLGHILTFIGFLISGTMMYMSVINRVVVLEEARTVQVQTDHRQDVSIDEGKKIVREDLREINSKLDRIIERREAK